MEILMHRRSFLAASLGLSVTAYAEGAFQVRSRADIPTPALLVDLTVFEANLRILADHCRRAGCGFRPHAKTHKCPEIARRQVASGALGVCVATVPEAEGMVAAGVRGVLLTSPVLERAKLARMAALVSKGEVLLSLG